MGNLTNDRPAIRIVIERATEIRCQAPHPLASKVARYRGQRHNAKLDEIPFMAKPTGRVVKTQSEIRKGYYGAFCKNCGMRSEYEIVAPEPASTAEAA